MANISTFYVSGADKYSVAIEGIGALAGITDITGKISLAARRAVNSTLDKTRTAAAQKIREGVAFPANYLDPAQGRLTVSRYAQGDALEGAIGARFRATSLARFVVGNPKRGAKGGGVQVMVKPGQVRTVAGGFMIGLKSGNQGLAVRSNGPPPRAWKPKPLGDGLWLLFGPSVNQAFGEVREDIAPAAAVNLELEFNRQMDL